MSKFVIGLLLSVAVGAVSGCAQVASAQQGKVQRLYVLYCGEARIPDDPRDPALERREIPDVAQPTEEHEGRI